MPWPKLRDSVASPVVRAAAAIIAIGYLLFGVFSPEWWMRLGWIGMAILFAKAAIRGKA